MACYIAVPLKKSYDLDLVKPLKTLISSYYSSADEPIECNDALNELNKLRMSATQKSLDKHENSIEVMRRYCDQISSLETKCPPQDVQIPFKWKDAFDKGSFFGGSATLTVSSLLYEKSCILFNIASMHSQLAVSLASDISDDDSIKMAIKHFQQAAGIFHYLKGCILVLLNSSDPTPDLQLDTLCALEALMLAQAQECFFHKAIADKKKNMIIAKIASQCDDLYAEATKLMQRESVKSLWEKEVLSIVSSKRHQYNALAEYFQSLVDRSNTAVGEELSRLQIAKESMKVAENKAGYNFSCKEYADKINIAHDKAKSDNDFIYYAKIPEPTQLPAIGKAALAKAIPVTEHLSKNYQDLFSNLLPVVVQQAVQVFDIRKTEIINIEIGKLREQTQIINATLASMNLPAALEDSGGDSLPPSLKEKIQSLHEKGGVSSLVKLIDDLPILLERNRDILDEAEKMLRDEEESDTQLRNQFKEKWVRTPSNKLNSSLHENITKYRQIITNAINADQIVKATFQSHRDTLILLSKPEPEILRELPSGRAVVGGSSMNRLKQLMQQVDELRREREILEEDFKSSTINMKEKFLSALAQDGAIPEESMSNANLQETFEPLQMRSTENIHRQETLLTEIQKANEEFCSHKTQDSAGQRREDVFKNMVAALDAYMDLSYQLNEGTKFYNDLTELLVLFQNKVSDLCFARRTERDELCKDLQTAIVKEAPTPSQVKGAYKPPASTYRPPVPTPPQHPVPTQRTFPSASTSSTPVSSAPPVAVSQANQMPQAYPQQQMPQAHPQQQMPYVPYPQYPYTYPTPMPQNYNPYSQPVMPYPHPQAPGGYQGMPAYPYPQPPPNYNYPPQYPPQEYRPPQ